MSDIASISIPLHQRDTPLTKSIIKTERKTQLQHGALGDFIKFANEVYKNDIAYINNGTNEEATFGMIFEEANKFANGLRQMGLHDGDRLAILSESSIRWVTTFWGAILAGLTVVPIFANYTPAEWASVLEKVGVKVLVSSPGWNKRDYYHIFKTMLCPEVTGEGKLNCKKLPKLKHVVFLDDKKRIGTLNWDEVCLLGSNGDVPTEIQVNIDNPGVILFTSGTTGVPKAVPISHFALRNMNNVPLKKPEPNNNSKRRQVVRIIEPPMGGIGNLAVGIILPAVLGDKVIIPAPFPDAIKICESIQKYKVNVLSSGTMSILSMLEYKDKYDFSSVRLVNASGMVIPRVLLADMEEEFKHIKSRLIYGSTECPAMALGSLNDIKEMRISNTGIPAEGVEIKITDDDNEIVDINQTGDIFVKNELTMKGYMNNTEATNEVITDDGWYRTGDLGFLDKNGYLTVVGRDKDVIKRSEFMVKIYPSEIEDVIDTHPKVSDSKVFSIYDEVNFTQMVGAAIILHIGKPGKPVHSSSAEIKHFLSKIIADYKIPDHIIFVNRFPRSGNCKVKVNKLREMLAAKIIRHTNN